MADYLSRYPVEIGKKDIGTQTEVLGFSGIKLIRVPDIHEFGLHSNVLKVLKVGENKYKSMEKSN